MNNPTKLRVFTPYNKLGKELQHALHAQYPYGFDKHLVTFKDKKGKFVSALPYETEDRYYMVKMTRNQAINIAMIERRRLEASA